jgi:anti-sigma regulatory factor (Ser/Thr protein kinase)
MHPALFYGSPREYLDGLVPFILDGLADGRPMLVAVPSPNLRLLRDALGDAAAEVTMSDMSRAGRNPGRILGGVLSSFADRHQGRPVWMIGEPIWSTRSAVEYPACVQHEALINHAFAGRDDVAVLCPYDVSELDEAVLADARVTHPVLWQAGAEQISPDYAPEAVWARYNEPLASSPTAVGYTVHTLADLGDLRAFAAAYARWFGLSSARVADLHLIATELAASGVQHAEGPCRVTFWHEHDHLVCEARDAGYLQDPLAGRRPYDRDTTRGRGLFVVNGVADLVRTHTAPGGTTIRAYLRLMAS